MHLLSSDFVAFGCKGQLVLETHDLGFRPIGKVAILVHA